MSSTELIEKLMFEFVGFSDSMVEIVWMLFICSSESICWNVINYKEHNKLC